MSWASYFQRIAASRKPDFIVGRPDDPYLLRWWLIPRNDWFNIYLHKFMRSDDDRALHDHPSPNLSVLLEGSYVEQTISAGGVHKRVVYRAGQIRGRLPWTAHRIEIDRPCWTLFITGPRIRVWGFHCERGWVKWTDFVDQSDHGNIGKGCNQ